MPTFRQLSNYSDGVPDSGGRLLWETSGNQPRGVAATSLPVAVANGAAGLMSGADKAKLDSIPATFLADVADDTNPALGGTLDGQGNPIIDYTQPFVSAVSGTLTQASHGGRAILVTGSVTVPVTNGFVCLIRNKSGANRTVSPASGNLIHEGQAKASVALPTNRSLLVHSDGTDVWADGALS